jgi:hypothetical protein
VHRFRGTDVGLGLLAIVVNVGLVVGVVLMTTGHGNEALPKALSTPSASSSRAPSASPSPSPTRSGRASKPADVFAGDSPVTVAILGDQTSDGEGEWVWAWSELLGRDRQVTLHQLDPQDPTVYKDQQTFGASGPKVAVYNGSRDDAKADYAARRLPFLAPKEPDLVVLNYGRNDSAKKVADRLEKTAKAAQARWKDALVVVMLQPPTANDSSKKVRQEVVKWAKKRGLPTLDVAGSFLDTGEADAYVSARDPSAMSSRGDQLWGDTAYRLLLGHTPPAIDVPVSTGTATSTGTSVQSGTGGGTRTTTGTGSAPGPTATQTSGDSPTVRPTRVGPTRTPWVPAPTPTPEPTTTAEPPPPAG